MDGSKPQIPAFLRNTPIDTSSRRRSKKEIFSSAGGRGHAYLRSLQAVLGEPDGCAEARAAGAHHYGIKFVVDDRVAR